MRADKKEEMKTRKNGQQQVEFRGRALWENGRMRNRVWLTQWSSVTERLSHCRTALCESLRSEHRWVSSYITQCVRSCILLDSYQRFAENFVYHEDEGSMLLRNVTTYLPHYTASQPTKLLSSFKQIRKIKTGPLLNTAPY
jgi:hypothetical protein